MPVSKIDIDKDAVQEQQYMIKDERAPLFTGTWHRSRPDMHPPIFAKDDVDEPHKKRRITILDRYPQIRHLYGHDPSTKWIAISVVVVQTVMACFLFHHHVPWYAFLIITYVIGGTMTNIAAIIIHDACHALIDPNPLVDRMWGMIANIVIPLPMAQSFRRYHLEHHTFQGVDDKDPDLPMNWERRLIRGSALAKLCWLSVYPFLYVMRGAAFGKRPSKWEIINWMTTLTTDYLIYRCSGCTGLLYLSLSTWLGLSLHPAAAHFIQEHYTFADGQETYSYYGILNKIFMNIGYHNEHHDFPQVPWSRLPRIREIGREYYEPLASHDSWCSVLWKFVTQPCMGPQSRCARPHDAHAGGRSMIQRIDQCDASAQARE